MFRSATAPGGNIIERAFELAPACTSIAELKRRLRLEAYFDVEAHLRGRQLRAELAKRLARRPPESPLMQD